MSRSVQSLNKGRQQALVPKNLLNQILTFYRLFVHTLLGTSTCNSSLRLCLSKLSCIPMHQTNETFFFLFLQVTQFHQFQKLQILIRRQYQPLNEIGTIGKIVQAFRTFLTQQKQKSLPLLATRLIYTVWWAIWETAR